MALTDIQMQAIQDAEDIDTGVDTRTKEEMLAEQMSNLKSAGKFLKEEAPMFIAESTPGLGEAIAIKRTSDAIDEEDYVGAGIEATAGVLGMVPIIGDAAGKTLRTATKSTRKGYNPEDPASRVFHLTKTDFDSADVVGKGTNDIGFHVGTAAQATSRGSSNVKYDKDLAEQMVKDERILPMVLKNKLKPARIIDVGSFKEPKNWIANLSVAKNDKQLIKFLLDEPADADLLAKAPRVTVGGDTYYMLPDVMRSGMDEKLWKDIILEAHRARRVGLNTINKQEDRVEWFNTLKQTANKNGYDSFVYKNEYEGASRDTVPSWQEELNTSSLDEDSYMLLEPDQAKGLFGGMTEGDPRYMKNEGGLMLQKGGAIPMDRQMSMFDEGGLEDDGGTVDPVSGNDVPPGSSKAEVRDDIPAQLSEGEFVFPADVVRYIGLEKLMMMRQQAKMGLKMMDEMGQMGNSDEATIPDDLPFNMMDLIIVDNEDEEEYNDKKEEKEMSEGGIVYAANGTSVPAVDPNSGVFYQPSQFAGQGNTPGVATVAPDAASRQFVEQARQSATPTVKYEKPETTYGDFLKPPQGGPQTITIVDSETGEKRKITFIPGVTEIPTGFVREEDYVAKEVVPEKETARVATTRVPTGDGENNDRNPGFATTDDTGIQYNSARLEEPLRDALRQYSMGPLTDVSPGMISLFGESKVKSGGGQAAVVGGILDAFRGGSATFSSPEKMGRLSGEYEDKDPLHTMSPQRQSVIAASINRMMESPEIKDIFVDGKGNRRTEAYAIEKAEALAKKYGVSLTSALEKKSFNTLMREIAKAKELAAIQKREADQKRNREEYRAKIREQIEQRQEKAEATKDYQDARTFEELIGSGSGDGGPGMNVFEAAEAFQQTSGDETPQQSEGSETGGYYDFNQGGLASKPKPKKTKKMKRGGLASKK